MRILRRIFLILLLLLIVGWIAGWFIGRAMILREAEPRLRSLAAANYTFASSGISVSGFPFRYSISPKNGIMGDRTTGQRLVTLSEPTSIRVSLPGLAYSYLTGGELGARINLSGTHTLGDGTTVSIANGWVRSGVEDLAITQSTVDFIFSGVRADLRDVVVNAGTPAAIRMDRLTLDMQSIEGGHAFDLTISDFDLGATSFAIAPSTVDEISMQGFFRPQLNGALMAFLEEAQSNLLGALSNHPDVLGELATKSQGVFIETGKVSWGDAQMDFNLSLSSNLRLLQMRGELVLDFGFSGRGASTLLRALAREPGLRDAGVPLLVNSAFVFLNSNQLDIENGTQNRISGPLLSFSPRTGLVEQWRELDVNGKPINVPGL